MLICTEGKEGKKLGVRILLSNKKTFFEKGGEAHPSITPEEEEWILKSANIPKGWKLEKKKEESVKKTKKGGD